MARRLTYVDSVIKNRVLYCVWIVLWFQGLSVVGVQQIDRVVEVVEETLKGKLRIAPNVILNLVYLGSKKTLNLPTWPVLLDTEQVEILRSLMQFSHYIIVSRTILPWKVLGRVTILAKKSQHDS